MRVAAAAIKDVDGRVFSVPPPGRHHNVLWLMHGEHGREQLPGAVQGFLLSDGRFVDRYEAKRVAVAAGQQIARAMNLPELYSEDVW